MTTQQDNQLQKVIDFVQKATKLGKYNANTGGGLINAIRAAEKGLLAEEPHNNDYLLEHLEELFFRQKDLNLSPQSQAVYFARIRRAVEDYNKYGTDAKSIYSWSPKQRAKKMAPKNIAQRRDESQEELHRLVPQNAAGYSDSTIREVDGIRLNVVTWRLRPGLLVKIELPEDLTKADVEKIKKLLDLEVE
jgi:hypothetical protein